MGSEDADTWAFCPSCERWFYCDGGDDTTVPAPACPVCASAPAAFEPAAGAPESGQDSASTHRRDSRITRSSAGGWLRLEE